jgi:hypothetical protein
MVGCPVQSVNSGRLLRLSRIPGALSPKPPLVADREVLAAMRHK